MKNKTKSIIQSILLAVGSIMLVYGTYRGEAVTVLTKAIKLCLECIGIG
ncbi:MAG: CD1871A family CXXC motif-containing protein [Sarcina ventriculi]